MSLIERTPKRFHELSEDAQQFVRDICKIILMMWDNPQSPAGIDAVARYGSMGEAWYFCVHFVAVFLDVPLEEITKDELAGAAPAFRRALEEYQIFILSNSADLAHEAALRYTTSQPRPADPTD